MIAKASFMRNDFLAQTIIKCHTLSAIYIISQLNVKKTGKTLEIGRFRRKREQTYFKSEEHCHRHFRVIRRFGSVNFLKIRYYVYL